MSYREIYKESNEQCAERFSLVMERIAQIAEAPDVSPRFADYFRKVAAHILKFKDITGRAWDENLRSAAECEAENAALSADVLPEHYGESYANPAYAVKVLGGEYGRVLCALYVEMRNAVRSAFAGRKLNVTIAAELFVEIYNLFEDKDGVDRRAVEQAVYSYYHDYSEVFQEQRFRGMFDPDEDFYREIVMNSDLSDERCLYRYGVYVGDNERGIHRFLNGLSEVQIQAMADTFTEGYRKGFEAAGKDLSKKKTVYLYSRVGFERVVRASVLNFKKLGLNVTMRVDTTPVNRQYNYDHREDGALYYDKAYVERNIEAMKAALEGLKDKAAEYAGPAVIEVFGEAPFSPEVKDEALKYDAKQNQLYVYARGMAGQILNSYVNREETSFTIISYPVPEIGEQFPGIFAETVAVNTLDYTLYRDMQQKIIDVLDGAKTVRVTGRGKNKTDISVAVWQLADDTETAFENCVADVNIPVGEVFTSPVLKGTNGKLHVTRVYLEGLEYKNLELDFKDGVIAHYTCTNFADEAENRKYISDNILKNHETLPMGEFAIGTNTTAYRMARKYNIADRMPILIAEKTGPHFAVGDTCYSHEEDAVTYNPDGKKIVARENDFSRLRNEDMTKAYFNCHTDITIPYDELDKITAVYPDGTTRDIISGGRFVLEGIEKLNEPLDKEP